jgi:hypothetical protein
MASVATQVMFLISSFCVVVLNLNMYYSEYPVCSLVEIGEVLQLLQNLVKFIFAFSLS